MISLLKIAGWIILVILGVALILIGKMLRKPPAFDDIETKGCQDIVPN